MANVELRTELMALGAQSALWLAEPDPVVTDAMPVLAQISRTDRVRFGGHLFVFVRQAIADQVESARAVGDDAQLRSTLGDAERLRQVRESAIADPYTARAAPVTCSAFGLTWEAEWSRLRGSPDPAAWGRSAIAWDALTRPHRAAYARWRQAEALLAQPGSRRPATEVLQTAATQAAQHVPLTRAIGDLARRARIELTDRAAAVTREAPPGRTFGLTDRELAVLRLLVDGKTNPEIAAALFMSPKTASVHVTHILRKLDVTSRVQAAALAERVGLLHADGRGGA